MLRDLSREFFAQIGDTKELRVTNVRDALNEALALVVFPKREDSGDPCVSAWNIDPSGGVTGVQF